MKRKRFLKACAVFLCLALLGIVAIFSVNGYVKSVGEARFRSIDQAADMEDVDCIIVLGCLVKENGQLSHLLQDRVIRALEVYDAGAAPKLLMSGDHGRVDYNEVGAMKKYAMDHGVPSEDVFMDHAGFSTYETVYRAKAIFGAKKVIIVTQSYHLSRALYIAEKLGLEAYGVPSDLRVYSGQTKRDVREILARCKDFAMCVFQPKPTYLGESIPISGSGDLTNDT